MPTKKRVIMKSHCKKILKFMIKKNTGIATNEPAVPGPLLNNPDPNPKAIK
jgi:hypothetical protein